MKQNLPLTWIAIAVMGVVLLVAGLIWSAPKNPTARIHVVDATGRPVAGAVVKPEGLRTKSGTYAADWYPWPTDQNGTPNDPVITDKDGYASVPYPKYVFERIETGTITFSVNHADFVLERPERVVSATPPAGTSLFGWRDYVLDRINHKTLIVHPDKVVLRKGAMLRLSVRADSDGPRETPLFAQISSNTGQDTNFWTRPEPNVVATRRLGDGLQEVRLVRFDAEGWAWFSDVTNIVAFAGQTNVLSLSLKRGVTLRGELDETAPRPIINGRVVVHVWPQGHKPKNNPPAWHTWTAIDKDGRFEIGSLPEGDLEIVAMCDGFVSTNGPGTAGFRNPQKHALGSNGLEIIVGMEPTARLEVHVTDDKGKPLKDADVTTWPNVRWGNWSATILVSDLYKTADWLNLAHPAPPSFWHQPVADFHGNTDSAGLAVLRNLPANVTQFYVSHPRFALPVIAISWRKDRVAPVKLIPGITNYESVQLEPLDKSPIAHD